MTLKPSRGSLSEKCPINQSPYPSRASQKADCTSIFLLFGWSGDPIFYAMQHLPASNMKTVNTGMPQSAVCGIYAFTEASGKAPVNTQCPQKPAEGIVSFTENNLLNQKSFPHI